MKSIKELKDISNKEWMEMPDNDKVDILKNTMLGFNKRNKKRKSKENKE